MTSAEHDPFAGVPTGADPFASAGPDPFAEAGGPVAEPLYQPAHPEVANGSLAGEDVEPEADSEPDPEPEPPEPPAADVSPEVGDVPQATPATDTETAVQESEAPTPRRRPKQQQRRKADGTRSQIRAYVCLEEVPVEGGDPAYYVVAEVEARNARHALRTAFRRLYGEEPLGTCKTLVVVPKTMWRPEPVENYQPNTNVAVRIGGHSSDEGE